MSASAVEKTAVNALMMLKNWPNIPGHTVFLQMWCGLVHIWDKCGLHVLIPERGLQKRCSMGDSKHPYREELAKLQVRYYVILTAL